jgi:hypothetical protein
MAGTVTVACKLPHGIILREFRMEPYQEPVLGGGWRETTRAVETGRRHRINGVASHQGQFPTAPDGSAIQLASGHALTFGVPSELWANWLDANKDSEMVRNGMVFAYEKQDAVTGKAKEMEGQRSGFERIDPANPPRLGVQKAA